MTHDCVKCGETVELTKMITSGPGSVWICPLCGQQYVGPSVPTEEDE